MFNLKKNKTKKKQLIFNVGHVNNMITCLFIYWLTDLLPYL